MASISGIKFPITAENKTAAVFAKIKSSVGSLNKTVLGLGAGLASVAGIGAFGIMAKGAMDTGDKIHKLNLRLGASAEALSQYRHVADMSGVSFEAITMGFQRMTKRVSEAAVGMGPAKDVLKEIGVNAEQLNKMAPAAQFETLADAIMKVENPADRVRIAMALFGQQGVALLQTMTGGSEGLRKMREEADSLGMTMSQDMVTGIADANDSMAKISSQVTGLVEQIMGGLAPTIEDLAVEISGWIASNRELLTQDLGTFLNDFIEGCRAVAPAVKSLGQTIGWLTDKIGLAMFKGWQFLEWAKSFKSQTAAGMGQGWADLYPAAPGSAAGGAAALAAAGGGEDYNDDSWIQSQGGGVTNNFNMQITRDDAVAISAESARQAGRQ